MKMQTNEAVLSSGGNGAMTKAQQQISLKARNATLKKFYETKIASLADRRMPLHLLKMLCQDVPLETGDLQSGWGRESFVRKCIRYYQGKLKEIGRSEKKGFFSFFHDFFS